MWEGLFIVILERVWYLMPWDLFGPPGSSSGLGSSWWLLSGNFIDECWHEGFKSHSMGWMVNIHYMPVAVSRSIIWTGHSECTQSDQVSDQGELVYSVWNIVFTPPIYHLEDYKKHILHQHSSECTTIQWGLAMCDLSVLFSNIPEPSWGLNHFPWIFVRLISLF